MGCAPLPEVLSPPALPEPLTIAPPALPSVDFDPELCCKILPFEIPTPALPFPPGTINAGVMAVLTAAVSSVQSYLDLLTIECPRE